MSGLLSVATGALTANQAILQTTGNNIANVNTPGYSRQNAVLQTVLGQYTGGGYIGKGVELTTIERNYSEFLTRQSALAGATSAGDTARSDKLTQLEGIFPGGTEGLGAAISDMLNSFSDVASAPTDLTARTVALTKIDETASRMSAASQSLDELQSVTTQEISQKVDAINNLAKNIANVNDQIARAQGSGQPPNDLLDQRDQMIRDLNQYIQTSSVPVSDGTVGIFIGGSQALVLGNTAATLTLTSDDFNSQLTSKLSLTRNGQSVPLNENTLGGGSVPGLLRFQNTDLVEGRNLLGRLTLAVTTSMNDQQKLGLDLDGNVGTNLFSPTDITNNVAGAKTNSAGAGSLTLGISDISRFAASDYEVDFSSATTGTVFRKSDGVSTAFTFTPGTATTDGTFAFYNPSTGVNDLPAIDGLTLNSTTISAPIAGDRFLLKPFSTSASNLTAEFSSPRALAVASPIAGKMGTTNIGSLQLSSLSTLQNPPVNVPVTIRFTGPNTYIRSDEVTGPPALDFNDPANFSSFTPFNYVSGTAIGGSIPATTPLSNWALTLQGAPKAGDTFTVFDIKDNSTDPLTNGPYNNNINLTVNSDNAKAMMNLRDVAMFDGSALTDGYASMISEIGVRAQSATYAANVSSSIAANLETQRTAVSGVNLDEEASKLIQYQQAYQASAKVIQIAQSIFNTLIQTMS